MTPWKFPHSLEVLTSWAAPSEQGAAGSVGYTCVMTQVPWLEELPGRLLGNWGEMSAFPLWLPEASRKQTFLRGRD